MAGDLLQPRVTRNLQNTQLSYELPHRIHTAKAYPIKSPNGSTIVLYGHENGVRIIWRGGRAFKILSEASAAPKKTNGATAAVISLDSDDEGSAAPKFEDKPEFEEDEEEQDPSKPYPAILQTLDLYFGTDVLHLALLPAPAIKAEGSSWRGLEPVKNKIVFTAACADNTLKLVTLPLTPPSPESKARPEFRSTFTEAFPGKGKWGETVVSLIGHEKPSDGVAMTADFGKSPYRQDYGSTETQIVVASHSREVTGLLLLYRISVKSPEPHIKSFQRICLASPAKSISFNPSLSGERSSQLLIAHTTGTCRIYDYLRLSTKHEEGSETDEAQRGSFLLSLHAGFQNTKDQHPPHIGMHAGFGRKSIVDAQWVSAGAAVIVLFSDGEWAVWDIEGVAPNAPKVNTIRGGAKTEYSLTGFIDAATKSRASGPQQITSSKTFAPMTPSTRKATEPFGAKGLSSSVQGHISVVEIAAASPTSQSEESIVFWLGENYTTIPSLSKYWAANSRKGGSGNLFNNNSTGSRMLRLDGIDLQGERCSGIEQITKPYPSSPEILVLGEHRFAILTTRKSTKELKPRQPAERLALTEKSGNNGELDVLGIDQALTRMDQSRRGKLFQT
ncbi:Nucleoporin [Lachnellula suecica]|uniref:Nucleoporin n=1 Tax=Lachnellula suecica TaxID=602035 RepID=A0A8T9C4J7_9HELO|nr:Nucleoporin [Lachnellula suecica]